MAELAPQNIVLPHEESQFIVDDVSKVIKQCIEKTLGMSIYDDNKVNQWSTSICDLCLDEVTKDQKPYKYMVTSVILQKNGGSLHAASSCYWNHESDGSCTVRWENPTIYCIVSVFGCAV